MLRLLVPAALLFVAIALSVLTDRPLPAADFSFINRGDVATLDLQKMSWLQDLRVARLLFEGLVKNDVLTPSYTIRPGVAERWEISPDGRTYTFHLRPDARWSNGERVTASDFIYAWRRGMLPDTACDYVAQFQLVRGGRAFTDWRQKTLEEFKAGENDRSLPLEQTAAGLLWNQTLAKFDELVGMKALDEGTLRIELERPTPYFLDLCAMGVFYPVYPPLVSRFERPDPRTGRLDMQAGWTKPPLLVSNGPFELTRWRFKRDMRLEKNKHFWDRDSINIDSIAIPSVEDPNAQVLAYTSGAVDWVSDVSPPYRREILREKAEFYDECRERRRAWEKGDRSAPEPPDIDDILAAGEDPIAIDHALPNDPRKNIQAYPAFGTYFYNFNCQPKLQDGRDNPFHDPRIRRAFAMAVDKRRIVESVRGVGENVSQNLIPVNSILGYRSPAGLPYDPAAARALLAEAGYPGGNGFITVEILFNKDGGHDVIAEAVAKDWQENLGVSVGLAQREIKVFRNDMKRQNFMVARAGWFGDYGDPTTFLDINRSNDANNDRKYNSPAFDAFLDRAADEVDPAARLRLLEQAEAMLIEDDLPLLPIFQYVQMYFFDPDTVSGISSHPRQQQDLFRIDMIGDGKGAERFRTIPPTDRPAISTDRSETPTGATP